MSAADPTQAIAAYLKTEIGALVENRVFRPELPRNEDEHMPRAAIVVMPEPGGYQLAGHSDLPVVDPRLAVVCYGSTRLEVDNIGREASVVLRALKPGVYGGVPVKWVRIAGSGVGLDPKPDPETLWPYARLSIQVLHAETV